MFGIKKKVLIVAATLRIGGAEKVARDIGLYADPEQFEVHYLVFGDEIGDYEQELQKHGCRIIHMEAPKTGYVRFVKDLRHLMRQNRYTAVHAHTMFNIGLIMLAAWLEKVPIRISHAHSALNDGGGMVKRVYEMAMRRLILWFATDLIACGLAAGDRLYGKKAFSKRGHLILNGIRTVDYRFNREARDRIRETIQMKDAFVLGHVGHLSEVKNQSYLIRLMPEILKRRPSAKLLMLGEGKDRSMLEGLVRALNLTERVIMTGNVRNVADYLSAMDVFAFPSLYEGMPLSVVEVQANGLPCVLSTGVPKDVYLTDLVRPLPLDKPDEWIEAICSARRNKPERYADELKEKGFDTETVMQKFLKIYERAEIN